MTAKKSRVTKRAVCMALRIAGFAGTENKFSIPSTFQSRKIIRISEFSKLKLFNFSRYLTIMVFLNDVEEGGECAFPVADNKTFSWKVIEKNKYFPFPKFPIFLYFN